MAATIVCCWAWSKRGLRLNKENAKSFYFKRAPLVRGPDGLFYVEVHVGCVLAAGVGLEVRPLMEAEHAGEDIVGEGLDLEVVIIHGAIEFPAGVVDPVLGAGNIGLEVLELLGRFQIGVGFGDGHQAGEGTLEIGLGALVSAERCRVVDIDLDAGGLGAGLDDFLEGGFFEVGRTFDRVDDATIEISTTLILRLNISQFIFYQLIRTDEPVVTAAGATTEQEDES